MTYKGFNYTEWKRNQTYRAQFTTKFIGVSEFGGKAYQIEDGGFEDGYKPIVRIEKSGSWTWIR